MTNLNDGELKLLFWLLNSKVFELEQVRDGALIGNVDAETQKENAQAMLVNIAPIKLKVVDEMVARKLV